jgi:prepilin-type N-terminal cleavage/methylation domain-containing protein
VEQVILHGFWQSERGFTLIEVMVVIIIMGVLAAIAMSFWGNVVEARRVDSATNQVASELRRAHTSSINRLEDWQVDLRPPGDPSSNYRMGHCEDPCVGGLPPPSLSLEERTEFPPGMSGVRVVFHPNGEAEFFGAAGNIIQVRSAADDGSPCHEIEVNEITSRIEVSPNAC